MRRICVGLLCAWVLWPALAAGDDLGPVKDEAVRLYDQGIYDQALTALHQLDTAQALDGPLLYRLFFCEKATGHPDEARKALERARVALEAQIPAARTLEESFYLANTYANLARLEDARNTARDATAKLEAGKIEVPATAMGSFQVGKLYQDQGREAEATKYYTKAVASFDLSGGRYGGNARWALRYLGNGAYARGDYAASESSLAQLTALGGADPADWETLATVRIRLGNYSGAAQAWKSLVKADPANADDPRYSARLAEAAASLAPLPDTAPDGAKFAAMTRPDLEAFLKTQAEAAIAARTQIAEAMQEDKDGTATKAMDPKKRAELVQTLLDTRKRFVVAGLEYAVKRFGIRETAFREGYAVLIFQERVWEVPPDPEPDASTGS